MFWLSNQLISFAGFFLTITESDWSSRFAPVFGHCSGFFAIFKLQTHKGSKCPTVCPSVGLPSYLFLCSECSDNSRTVRPPLCYICTALRHWPGPLCSRRVARHRLSGPSWRTIHTTGHIHCTQTHTQTLTTRHPVSVIVSLSIQMQPVKPVLVLLFRLWCLHIKLWLKQRLSELSLQALSGELCAVPR